MHEAFYFGTDDRQIFAVYHPSVSMDGRVLTVICPPFFSELNRTHSLLRRLALILAEKGQHVLRLDYSGTGDSFGILEDVTMADWENDIVMAVKEGQDLSGCRTIRLLGVRGSALLACKAARRVQQGVDRLVFWDPAITGADYLESLGRLEAKILDQHHYLGREERDKLAQDASMYKMAGRMLNEIRSLDSGVYAEFEPDRLRVVSTDVEAHFPMPDVTETRLPVSCEWEVNSDDVIVSQPVLEALTSCLTTQ